jgi:hypothetical protein
MTLSLADPERPGDPVVSHEHMDGFSPAASTADLTIGSAFLGYLDNFDISRDVAVTPPAVTEDEVGNPIAVIDIEPDGTAEFYVRWTAGWDPNRYLPETLNIEATYSDTMVTTLSVWGLTGPPANSANGYALVTDSRIVTSLHNLTRAMLYGTEGLGDGASTAEYSAAMLTEFVPLLADLRTLTFEAYKFASGCDEVSTLNVSLAVTGLFIDIATFGTAGNAVRTSGKIAKEVGALFLKELKTSIKVGALTTAALGGIIKGATWALANADAIKAALTPDHWAESQITEDYLDLIKSFGGDTNMEALLEAAVEALPDGMAWLDYYRQCGDTKADRDAAFIQFWTDLQNSTP